MSNTTTGPVEAKVTAASAAAGVAVLVITALANALRDTDSALLLALLPQWVEPVVLGLLAALPSFLAGYQAPHTPRPDITGPRHGGL